MFGNVVRGADAAGLPQKRCYPDRDRDGYGGGSGGLYQACPAGYVTRGGDCADTKAVINPGAQEVCDANNVDEDCDGRADDADSSVSVGSKTVWYRDSDGDGEGGVSVRSACDEPVGYVSNNTDCNDSDRAVYSVGSEVCADGIDNNCDQQVDEALCSECPICHSADVYEGQCVDMAIHKGLSIWVDDDGDCDQSIGDYGGDCDPANPDVNSYQYEFCADGIDNNCDQQVDEAVCIP